MVAIPWILTAFRGAIIFVVAVFLFRRGLGADWMSWHVLWFGIPSHLIADFAGSLNVFNSRHQQAPALGICYLLLVLLAAASWITLNAWAALLVFLEGWLIGLPAGYRRTIRDLDRSERAGDSAEWL